MFNLKYRDDDEISSGTILCKVALTKLKDAKLRLTKKQRDKIMKAIEDEKSDKEEGQEEEKV